MKKTRREMSGPRAVVNYKNRATTEVTIKRKPVMGLAGVRPPSDLSDTTENVAQNIAAEINDVEDTVLVETAFEANSPSTDTSTPSSDLTENAVADETVDIAATEADSEINEIIDTVVFVPTMDNTKKEIAAHADELGIEVKAWWGKQKILDAIQH